MRRRTLITGIGSLAAAWPLNAIAQQGKLPVIAFLNLASAVQSAERIRAFHQGLAEMGYVEGRNVAVEYRWANNDYNRLPTLAAELVGLRVDVIAATSARATRVAKAATTNIPVVFYIGSDPVKTGLVSSLNRPGGNLTGAFNLADNLMTKRLEALHEAVSNTNVIALLVNPKNPAAESQARDTIRAANKRGVTLHVVKASDERELEGAITDVSRVGAGALVIGADLLFASRSQRLAELAMAHRVPAIHQFREFAVAGGLISFGTSFTHMYRLVGNYAGRILRGERPADLPVQQPTKFELVINLKTAKAFGIAVPTTLLARADEVIE